MREPASAHTAKFLESYRAAFERLDAEAIADHFAYPGHVTSDGGDVHLTPIVARDEWRRQIDRLVEMYRTIGVRSVHILRVTSTDLSPRVFQAKVHWVLRDGTGSDLYDFHALYTLVEVDGGLRIGAVAHDEILRSQELMAQRRSDASTLPSRASKLLSGRIGTEDKRA